MSDVFISYAHSTAREARAAAETLRDLGYSVWLDEDLPANRAFTHAIQEELANAKAALIIWSADAAQSEWVLSEANRAREARKLVQVSVDGVRLPMPFDQIQCADLSGWSGEAEHPAWPKVLASVADLVRGGRPHTTPSTVHAHAAPAERRLAVLAFDNLSPDPEMSFFSDGVSEEILETVSRNTDLQVIGRASSFQFRGSSKAARHVAAELNVSHVLDGSVRRSGSHVRISAQLVDCASEARIWSERYDRDLTDTLALQDEIATAVAEALKAEFSRAGPSPGKLDPVAYDLYLRARDLSITGPVAPRIEMLERCVALAPRFASAWASLAEMRVSQAIFARGDLALAPLAEAARDAVATAERLDPTMGLTRVVRASLEPWAAYQRREDLLSEGLRLTPGDPACLIQMSLLLGFVGRRREARALAEEARSRDPLLLPAAARSTSLDDRYDEQSAQFDAMRAKWPANIEASLTAAEFAAANADWPRYEALQRHAYAQPFADDPARGVRRIFRFWDAIRDHDHAYLDNIANRMLSRVEATGTVPLDSLMSAAIAGHVDAAFQAVDRARFDGVFDFGGHVGRANPGTMFRRSFGAALMDDPRFLRLCAKLGMVHYWLETGRWPDCADQVPYDFRAEARKVAAEGLARHV
jgi:TolB-like protein